MTEVETASTLGSGGFATVYQGQFAFVVNSLRRLGIPPRDLEDLTHDVFMTVLRRRDSYDPGRPIKPWLFGIAFRVASDFRKLVRHVRELPLDEGAQVLDAGRAPDETAALRQEQQLVLDALARIPLDRRAVFVMHDIEGIAVPEIASSLDIPLGTAYSRLRQARAEFAEAVREIRQGGAR